MQISHPHLLNPPSTFPFPPPYLTVFASRNSPFLYSTIPPFSASRFENASLAPPLLLLPLRLLDRDGDFWLELGLGLGLGI